MLPAVSPGVSFMTELEAVILAAGQSRRMGRNKLLLPLGDSTVIGQVLSQFPYSLFAGVSVVYADPRVGRIARRFPVRLIANLEPETGKSVSIRLGLLAGNPARGVLFSVADQPLLTAATISKLVLTFRENPGKIILPTTEGTPANPVIFPADLRQELLQLTEDEGGSRVIRRHHEKVFTVPFGCGDEFFDMDKENEYQKILREWRQKS